MIYEGELFRKYLDGEKIEMSGYPEIVIADDNGLMVSLLLNEGNDFVSIEFQSNRVRDVFCLLLNKIK